jgi:hypothetical protein
VLVADFVIPPGNAPHPGKWMDLHMLVMLGGRERTEQDFAVLFESAGFRLSGVVPRAARSRSVEGRPSLPIDLRRHDVERCDQRHEIRQK